MSTFRYPDKPVTSSPQVLDKLKPGDWLAEMKYDGYRCVTTWDGVDPTFVSRENKPLAVTKNLCADVVRLLKGQRPMVLDGEWTGLRQAYRKERLYLFDVLAQDGHWIGHLSAAERVRRLPFVDGDLVLIADHQTGQYRPMFERSKSRPETEGIVLKHIDSPFIGSVRGCVDNPRWMKVKWRGGPDGAKIGLAG